MKIGILTFHTSVNYGAVLQTYALQSTLSALGHDAWVIDFDISKRKKYRGRFESIPVLSYFSGLRRKQRYFARRSQLIAGFDQLHLTRKLESIPQLKECADDFEVLIAGSDQIWNPNFICSKNQNLVPAYFLDFGSESVKRISYAASFGQSEIPEWYANEIIGPLKRFSSLSVREESGKNLLESLGFHTVETVCDPTILMPAEFFRSLASQATGFELPTVFQFTIRQVSKLIESHLEGRNLVPLNLRKHAPIPIAQWLKRVDTAAFVVTDSFHCVIFCLKFHTPFVVLQVKRKGLVGMNTRLEYLLGRVGLTELFVDADDAESVERGMTHQIDWEEVDRQLLAWAESSRDWLSHAIDG